ncbi:MAG: TIGR00341 family protein [Muribaculaceae bacterium]|nr:TIGR00341 family protein [Muribaculaceae bacterium]
MKLKLSNRLTQFFVSYFAMSNQLLPQAEAEQSIRDDVSFRGTNIVILVLAILIASLGLNTNSTAVIIGAMLISPLMGPIIGIGLGVGIHDFELIKRALRNLGMAAGFSVIASTLYFFISPVSSGHSELLARTSPTIYDVLIGFVGGFAGILAIGSRSKGNVIPGVAIATALMPPLCTAGYGIATGQPNYFFGAFYLFLINSIYIAFATFIGVKILGYKGESVVDNQRAHRVMKTVYVLAVLTMLPSIWLTVNMLKENKFVTRASEFVAQECRFPDTQVVSEKAYIDNGKHIISISLIGQTLDLDSLELALSSRLKFYNLEGTELKIIQGSLANSGANANTGAIHDVYSMAQQTIVNQQHQIDSLRQIISDVHAVRAAGELVAPEIKVLFPEVRDIAVNSSVFAAIDTTATDTVNVALVRFSRAMPPEQLEKFREYLEARLGMKNIEIVSAAEGHKHVNNHK